MDQRPLPEQFVQGLTTASLPGRAQIVPDKIIDIESPGDLVFYLDGAHSPESMEICARWFSSIVNEDKQRQISYHHSDENSRYSPEFVLNNHVRRSLKDSTQVEYSTLSRY